LEAERPQSPLTATMAPSLLLGCPIKCSSDRASDHRIRQERRRGISRLSEAQGVEIERRIADPNRRFCTLDEARHALCHVGV
jgi:hypothetical protein